VSKSWRREPENSTPRQPPASWLEGPEGAIRPEWGLMARMASALETGNMRIPEYTVRRLIESFCQDRMAVQTLNR
jgi:hypothetical protein